MSASKLSEFVLIHNVIALPFKEHRADKALKKGLLPKAEYLTISKYKRGLIMGSLSSESIEIFGEILRILSKSIAEDSVDEAKSAKDR